MKKVIITMDTEGDNLWKWKLGDLITTQNAMYLQRFQDLCNNYSFKPVWLSNYEMIQDSRFVDFISKVEEKAEGELGMHLHAWNSPPEYKLTNIKQNGAPYLIEYPTEIMEEKIDYLTSLIKARTGIIPTSHRAGRWAMDERYFYLLIKYGYTVDCSVTPGINWCNSVGATPNAVGSDYSECNTSPYWIQFDDKKILEIPVTIRKSHKIFLSDKRNLKNICKSAYYGVKGSYLWLRPQKDNLNQMLELIKKIEYSKNDDYIMFMLHSSELMPGGSPNFETDLSIENLYKDLEVLFKYLSNRFEGITLRQYYKDTKDKIN